MEDCVVAGLSLSAAEGLEGGVVNSSIGGNSSNLVKVTSTLMVGITGMATLNRIHMIFQKMKQQDNATDKTTFKKAKEQEETRTTNTSVGGKTSFTSRLEK